MVVLNGIRTYLVNNLNTYINALSTEAFPLDEIEDKNVVIDEVDTDRYLSEIMIYLIPEEYTYERNTFSSDNVVQRLNIFLFVRKDTSTNLINKLFKYNSALKSTIRDNPTFNALVDDCVLVSQFYYQGVEGTKDIKGMEYNINVSYQEEY